MRRTHKRRNRSRHHRPNRDMTVYPCEGVGAAEHARIRQRMELYDSLSDEEAALVQEYGLRLGLEAARQFYGHWAAARAYCQSRIKRV